MEDVNIHTFYFHSQLNCSSDETKEIVRLVTIRLHRLKSFKVLGEKPSLPYLAMGPPHPFPHNEVVLEAEPYAQDELWPRCHTRLVLLAVRNLVGFRESFRKPS